MPRTAIVRAQVDRTLKREAEHILKQLGFSPTTAITMFYELIALRRALPFEAAIPNATTRAAMADAQAGRVTRATDSTSVLKQLDADG